MKAVTIIQPFAHLIAIGQKRVENRKCPTSYRGPIAIHAGKAKRYGGEPVREIAKYYEVDPASLVFGAVIATARLVACVDMERVRQFQKSGSGLPDSLQWLAKHRHAEGPWCWVLDSVTPLEVPKSIDGKLGLWNWYPRAKAVGQ